MVEVFGLVNNCGAARYTAIVVDEDVAHDREDPSLEIGVVDILALVVERLECGVLEQVIRVFPVRGEHIGKVKKVCLKAHQFCLKFL